jgi:hypothetical protein
MTKKSQGLGPNKANDPGRTMAYIMAGVVVLVGGLLFWSTFTDSGMQLNAWLSTIKTTPRQEIGLFALLLSIVVLLPASLMRFKDNPLWLFLDILIVAGNLWVVFG